MNFATYTCKVCACDHNSEQEAMCCCHCLLCGEPSSYDHCEECYSDRHCECCGMIYEGENPEDGMRYGCHEENYDEDTLCNGCWLDLQPPLVQLAGALLE
ncbi:MAG TPA: hypothetical protein VM537_15175 [Anaerolineae bacterium]|nr:hypothetical protein [Anaerolineae bacterium]